MRALVFFLAITAMTGCSGQDGALRASLLQEISDGEAINLTDIQPHDWERMCVFPPYTTNEATETALQFQWDIERRTGIEMRDDYYVVALVRDQAVVSYTEIPRGERELIHSELSCFQKQAGPITWHPEGGWTQREATDR